MRPTLNNLGSWVFIPATLLFVAPEHPRTRKPCTPGQLLAGADVVVTGECNR
jgi:hypothetical protein